MLQPPNPILVANRFLEILDHLLELLTGLRQEEWQQPTICAGWSVKDVALHLLGEDIGNLSVCRDGHVAYEPIQDWDELIEFINA